MRRRTCAQNKYSRESSIFVNIRPFASLLTIALLAIMMRIASTPTANLSYLLIAGYAMLGRSQVIHALAISWLLSMINPALAPEASAGSVGRYLVIFAAALSVSLRTLSSGKTFSLGKLSKYTLGLSLIMLLHSILFSAVVDVSVLKVTSWMVVILTLLFAWQGLTTKQHSALFKQLEWVLIWLILFSLPFLAIPAVGYARNGTGFQGLLNHPQAFGPTVALVAALVGGRIIGERNPAWRDIILLWLCLVLIVLSEARTAGAAMVLGLLGSALLSPLFARSPRRIMLQGLRSRRIQTVGLISMVAAILAAPLLAGTLSSYLFKRSEATDLVTAADASRGALVVRMFSNILEHPMTGIGFGIASQPEYMEIERDAVLGLPLSAAVEKGVMPIAVIEEMGILGALTIFAWLLMILRNGARSGVSQFAVLITLLLINFGESMLFSVGGMGMLLLILLSGAVTGEQKQ